MANQQQTHTFIISLPKDRQRREHLEKQLRKRGMPYSVVSGVHGASLTEAELDAAYDRRKAIRLFNRELSKGEIGCALSHLAVYRKMVEEDIPDALVLEDDADLISRDLPATLAGLARLYMQQPAAQTPVAVLLNHVRRYDGNSGVRLDDEHAVYDAYRGVCAHGYFITRAAADILLRELHPVYVVADKWEYFQERFIDVKALVPYAIGVTSASLLSSIDAMGERTKKVKSGGNVRYYLRRNLEKLRFLIRSRPFIRIVFQDEARINTAGR